MTAGLRGGAGAGKRVRDRFWGGEESLEIMTLDWFL